MLVQQTTHYLHQQKQARILLKLDIRKAFDSVSWPFMLEVLRNLGFGPIWCDIINGLLASSSNRVILNGNPGEIIKCLRGSRQGDPLSPMLFILPHPERCSLCDQEEETINHLLLSCDQICKFQIHNLVITPLRTGGIRRAEGWLIKLKWA